MHFFSVPLTLLLLCISLTFAHSREIEIAKAKGGGAGFYQLADIFDDGKTLYTASTSWTLLPIGIHSEGHPFQLIYDINHPNAANFGMHFGFKQSSKGYDWLHLRMYHAAHNPNQYLWASHLSTTGGYAGAYRIAEAKLPKTPVPAFQLEIDFDQSGQLFRSIKVGGNSQTAFVRKINDYIQTKHPRLLVGKWGTSCGGASGHVSNLVLNGEPIVFKALDN